MPRLSSNRAPAPRFERETDLCAAFITTAKRHQPQYRFYPETGGWDILAVRDDGAQVGIEAKLRFNNKVVAQSLPDRWSYGVLGPDFRAVLVPADCVEGDLTPICIALGIGVIGISHPDSPRSGFGYSSYHQPLPSRSLDKSWHEWAPENRHKVPEYVPDVAAGASAPLQLTPWKVNAIKLAIVLESRPLTRADFRAVGVDPGRWTAPVGGWLVKEETGYVVGPHFPDFRRQHPINYEQIKADRAKWEWASPVSLLSAFETK